MRQGFFCLSRYTELKKTKLTQSLIQIHINKIIFLSSKIRHTKQQRHRLA